MGTQGRNHRERARGFLVKVAHRSFHMLGPRAHTCSTPRDFTPAAKKRGSSGHRTSCRWAGKPRKWNRPSIAGQKPKKGHQRVGSFTPPISLGLFSLYPRAYGILRLRESATKIAPHFASAEKRAVFPRRYSPSGLCPSNLFLAKS